MVVWGSCGQRAVFPRCPPGKDWSSQLPRRPTAAHVDQSQASGGRVARGIRQVFLLLQPASKGTEQRLILSFLSHGSERY